MKLLSNIENNHLSIIDKLISESKEIYIAIAFLKQSGFSLIETSLKKALKRGAESHIIAGQNFALTEPSVLHNIYKISQKNNQCHLYLAKASKEHKVFHPKLYLFKAEEKCTIISGSANMTKGGLTNNEEVSLLIECKENDNIWKESLAYYQKLTSVDNAHKASLLIIKQYESFYNKWKKHNKNSQSHPDENTGRENFNYSFLVTHLDAFNSSERKNMYNEKKEHYKYAKEVLDEMVSTNNISKKHFQELLDELVVGKNRLWHSSGMDRRRTSIYNHQKQFIELVKFIKKNKDKSPDFVFGNAMEKVKSIVGASVNYVAEIMMTYNHKNFANLNSNPITVLGRHGGLNIKLTAPLYKGEEYKEYCQLIKEICNELDLTDMLEADTFFNEIYWEIKQNS